MLADSPEVTGAGLSHLGSVIGLKEVYLHNVAANSITDSVLDSLHTNKTCKLWEIELGHYTLNKEQLNVTAAAVTRSDSETRTTRIHPGSYSVPTADPRRGGAGGGEINPTCGFSQIN